MIFLLNIWMSFVVATGLLIFSFVGDKQEETYSALPSLNDGFKIAYNNLFDNALSLSIVFYLLCGLFVWLLMKEMKKMDELDSKAEAGESTKLFTTLEPLEAIKTKATAGDPEYIYRLARCYERGESVPRDYKQALELYAEASDLGHGAAAWEIAQYFDQGLVVPQNKTEEIRFIGIAAERKHPDAVKYVRAMTEPPKPSRAGDMLAAGIIGAFIGGAIARD